ncbi:SDR family NAD(P)-dependent oxidoreductase [Leadbettera azotonutricia]|uniref:2,5-dichloro-2,5-cyclohexadiene-1,4-diol dehydrogenase (2,5-ddol dehydrogenase) n=1 Tax=Leadbettera azotonutricia (strain ATCC BAA-888 / DSM 13862 / ZAS-9) TaxID=545695 RepID=F5YED8_LEAAZ|nr:glucose 1-dehydrogenase [Leadbettera azotonutricia]AEF83327.1 2,5-dichloro-2,5-cyclohexadiene-1,4-diol dehydrogenase (2,5-ddol dehydrogenase) [Leadbettera azotonutricia ZAS-9]
MRLKDKVVLITGGAQGLGEAIAKRFTREGAVVFIGDLKAETGNAAVEGIRAQGGKAFFLTLDVTSEKSWIDAVATVEKECGRLDVLVNNAGINIREPIEEMKVENLDAMLAVNVKGPFLGCKHSIPALRKSGGGSIINMSSVCGLVGHKYTPEAYTVTKGAVTLLTKTIAVRFAKDNIRCNSLHPSTVETALVAERLKDPKFREDRLGEVPLGRLAGDTDVANAALFLASDEAAFINGVAFPVDGGTTAD